MSKPREFFIILFADGNKPTVVNTLDEINAIAVSADVKEVVMVREVLDE